MYVLVIVGIITFSFLHSEDDNDNRAIASASLILMFSYYLIRIVIRWLYYALLESSGLQATIGKLIMDLKVVNDGVEKIGFARATGRFFGRYISILVCVGFMLAGWTDRKQALHDMLAGTFVVFRNVEHDELPRNRDPMPWYGWLINVVSIIVFLSFWAGFIGIIIIGIGRKHH